MLKIRSIRAKGKKGSNNESRGYREVYIGRVVCLCQNGIFFATKVSSQHSFQSNSNLNDFLGLPRKVLSHWLKKCIPEKNWLNTRKSWCEINLKKLDTAWKSNVNCLKFIYHLRNEYKKWKISEKSDNLKIK